MVAFRFEIGFLFVPGPVAKQASAGGSARVAHLGSAARRLGRTRTGSPFLRIIRDSPKASPNAFATDSEMEKLATLSEFLLLPAEPEVTEPPSLPPSLNGLPHAVYLEAARHYIKQYPFDQEFHKYKRKSRARYSYTADTEWKEKARMYLQACINVDRSGLAPITSDSYDAAREQQQFVRKILFPRRWKLEELASEMLALAELLASDTQTTSAVETPMDTELKRKETVKDQVRVRDQRCRLTGVGRMKSRPTPEERVRYLEARQAVVKTLQVVHGLPFQVGNTTFALVEALTGIDCQGWVTDSIQNAFLAQPAVHDLFGAFQIFLEWAPTGEIFIRGRTGAANPILELQTIVNDRFRLCHLPGQFLDTPLRPCLNTSIADFEPKFFILHKFIGDIVWMCGGAEPVSDDEEDDEQDVVSTTNVDMLIEKLQSPKMELVPREREQMFGSRMTLVPKNSVWG
ncbi:hypothetical protein B0H11DRAFT_1982850 [Mycena galericulata]|nr:hypothetical protein B0H11DRAFT_1982850 [Mycena galericulata]